MRRTTLPMGVVLATAAAALWMVPAAADVTTMPTETTVACPAITAPAPVLVVSPVTFAPGQTIHATGSMVGEPQVAGDCVLPSVRNGPQVIYLLIHDQVITFATVAFVNGAFDTTLTVPADLTARGPGLLQYDPSLGSYPAVAVTVVSPAGPAKPVPASPVLTG